jgi:osmotically-inducible protein OsmY
MLNENLISDEIRANYGRDPRLPHPGEVAVSERAGAVTLRGTVGTPQQRHAAVAIAKSVRGVRDVYDELSVDPRDHWEDAEIRGAALQALMSSPGVRADQIEVKVDAAWLTMKGEVKRQDESDAAFEAVSQVSGVGGITNRITVITAGGH